MLIQRLLYPRVSKLRGSASFACFSHTYCITRKEHQSCMSYVRYLCWGPIKNPAHFKAV